MNSKKIQELLPFVDMPSRYLGSEINSIIKDKSKVKLKIALAFPDLYEIGTSHFGLQILYHILNSNKNIAAERVYSPGSDMEDLLRSTGTTITSLESGRPINTFDIIGFSLLYELNYTNILTLLDLGNIPFLASERDVDQPIIIAGGPCTCNPEPVSDFFDAMVIGDGEEVIMQIALSWIKWKENSNQDKQSLLKVLSNIKGVYVPSFFKPIYTQTGLQILKPEYDQYKTVTRAVINDLNNTSFPHAPVIPYGKPVHDRLRLEISRGCTRGCRFCQAGMIYRPVRERSPETLLGLAETSLAETGYDNLSLLSLSTGDYGCIAPLMSILMSKCSSRHIAISLPSLRAGTLTPELISLIKKVRKTGFTIAPEAGSQRLRDVINKNITEDNIIETVENTFALGWNLIKLYFMIGLPTETDDDIKAIVDFVKNLRKILNKKRSGGTKGKINVSVTTFIPKSHTPFQWETQISLEQSMEKIKWLKKSLNIPGIHFKWQNPETSLLEGLWARGDRRLGSLLKTAYKKGCRFDGWSDKFSFPMWQEAFDAENTDVDFYTTRKKSHEESLPWDVIDTKVTKNFLLKELQNGLKGHLTSDCRETKCNTCGVCDFKTVFPITFNSLNKKNTNHAEADKTTPDSICSVPVYNKIIVNYSKQNQAKYFGHLELVNIFLRAIKRAGIIVKHSEGFHPKPKISFTDSLPIGMESLNEVFYLTVSAKEKPSDFISKVNTNLPEGLYLNGCQIAPSKINIKKTMFLTYMISLNEDCFDEDCFDEEKLKTFIQQPECIYSRTNKKGKTRTRDLKDYITKIILHSPKKLEITVKSEQGKTVRPFEVVLKIFRLPEKVIKKAAVVKIYSK